MIPAGRPLPLPAPQVDLAAVIAALDEPLRRVQATLRRQAAKAQSTVKLAQLSAPAQRLDGAE
jgi:hypothetical protein